MEFQAWPKTARLYRDVVVTEKIDGTNACVIFEPYDSEPAPGGFGRVFGTDSSGSGIAAYTVGAQSRNRLLTIESDNHGFARWVAENRQALFCDLGPGRHFGEFWGQGIQRRYGLDHKRFSLFNVDKWGDGQGFRFRTPNLHVVPVLYHGDNREHEISLACDDLRQGSKAAPGFDNPEGICVFHTQSRKVYKYTLDGDGHKG